MKAIAFASCAEPCFWSCRTSTVGTMKLTYSSLTIAPQPPAPAAAGMSTQSSDDGLGSLRSLALLSLVTVQLTPLGWLVPQSVGRGPQVDVATATVIVSMSGEPFSDQNWSLVPLWPSGFISTFTLGLCVV